jgi:hypothetical protein
MGDVDAGLGLEQLAGDVLRRADSRRGVGQLAGLLFGERHQLGERLDRNVVVDRDDARHGQQPCHGRKVALHVVGLARGEQRRIDGQRAIGAPVERGAIRRRLRHTVAADAAAGARHVLHRDRHAPKLSELGGEQSRRDIGRATRGEPDDETHRLVRIGGLRPDGRGEQQGKQRGKQRTGLGRDRLGRNRLGRNRLGRNRLGHDRLPP